MHGRSDATLNPGGVRIGTAELYRAVENMEEINDSVVVGQKYEDDERVILFVKMNEGTELTDELQKKIRSAIRTSCSPRHVPTIILETPDVPYTINGKKVEVAVKKIIHGEDVYYNALGIWWADIKIWWNKVTHWMPLPEPPK